MKELILLVFGMLASLPAAYVDREEAGREERMRTISAAVAHAAARASCAYVYTRPECSKLWGESTEQLAAALVAKGWWESRFARNVHEGNCGDTECDAVRLPGGLVHHKARSSWQLQKTGFVQRDEWGKMVGTSLSATRTAAWVAARVLAEGYRRCQSVRGALSWYAAQTCDWSGSYERHRTVRRLLQVQS